MVAALRTHLAIGSLQSMITYLTTMAQHIRALTPREAARWKLAAELANVSDEEMEDFKQDFFQGGEPPMPLAEIFGSDDATKVYARIHLTQRAEREKEERKRGQASK